MQDFLTSKEQEAKQKEEEYKKKEEEKKQKEEEKRQRELPPEEKFASIILDLIESTLKPRSDVIKTL